MNYAARLPLEKNNVPYQYVSAVTKQTTAGSPSASSVITLSPNTTTVEITAYGTNSGASAIWGRWGSSSVTASTADFIVNTGTSKLLAVPINTTSSSPASVAGANAANGLFSTISLNNALAAAASVLVIEYF